MMKPYLKMVVVGLAAFLFGLPASPLGEPAVRAALEAEEQARGLGSLYQELCRADPAAASSIHPNDRYRIVRALEILRVTGRPRSDIAVPRSPRGDWRFLVIGLAVPRADLERRIASRVAGMFEQGLVREVQGLLRSGCTERDPGMRGIGYREFFTMRRGCVALGSLAALISGNTLKFAKRQMTFFRAIPDAVWVQLDRADGIAALIRSARSAQRVPGPGP
jgi:tRNA dimethylallyltransferase